ncbi:TonB-dependent siderophore receptor [Campylobacter fetus]|nr:TonB-dependent siderophore receptor [Campylobacter fetus]
MKKFAFFSILAAAVIFANDEYNATLPPTKIESKSDVDELKGYVGYDRAQGSRTDLLLKETPQTIDILDISRNKSYGQNDLSSILEGTAGIDTTYDMRADNIFIRGFNADAGDIYRDGVRDSGQVRRSTANIERIEILKGPNSVLYGRGAGGGVINMISKVANFNSKSLATVGYGSYDNRYFGLDINHVFNENFAARVVGDLRDSNSYRDYIEEKSKMISPSIIYYKDNFSHLLEYTYDYAKRVPDRGPTKDVYEQMGIDYKKTFARQGDIVEDKLQMYRSKMNYDFNDKMYIEWVLAYRKANQSFDHYFGGSYDPKTKLLSQSYAWQNTDNSTLLNSISANLDFDTFGKRSKLLLGYDFQIEKREPLIGIKRNQNIDPFSSRTSWGRINTPAASIDNKHKATNHGVFVQELFYITDSFKFALGGRLDEYKFSSRDIKNRSNEYKGDNFSYNYGLVYDINSQHTAYAAYNKSFSPYGGNGYVGISTTTDPKGFNTKPENSQQYEVGIKSDWLNNSISTTLSTYLLEHYNIRYRPDPVNDPFTYAIRGKEQSKGVEFSAIGKVSNNVYIRSSVGFMKARVKKDKQNPLNEGRHLSGTGDFNANVFIRYIPIKDLYAEIGAVHSSKKFYYSSNGKEINLDGFTRYDALVGYNYKNLNLSFAVQNLFDKRYWRSSAMPGTPRNFMANISYKF